MWGHLEEPIEPLIRSSKAFDLGPGAGSGLGGSLGVARVGTLSDLLSFRQLRGSWDPRDTGNHIGHSL